MEICKEMIAQKWIAICMQMYIYLKGKNKVSWRMDINKHYFFK